MVVLEMNCSKSLGTHVNGAILTDLPFSNAKGRGALDTSRPFVHVRYGVAGGSIASAPARRASATDGSTLPAMIPSIFVDS
jgi:hypothetical protein